MVDYSSDPDQDDTNIKVDFEGSRLREWLDSPEGKRGEEGDGRSAGVRWSEYPSFLVLGDGQAYRDRHTGLRGIRDGMTIK